MKTSYKISTQLIICMLFFSLLQSCGNFNDPSNKESTSDQTVSSKKRRLISQVPGKEGATKKAKKELDLLSSTVGNSAQDMMEVHQEPATIDESKNLNNSVTNETAMQQYSFDGQEKALTTNSTQTIAKKKHKKQFSKDWEKFTEHYDDSSDEETTTSKVQAYQLLDNTKEFEQEVRNSGEKADKQKHMLSFIAHAVGLQVLYGKEVANKYYPLKHQYLSSDDRFKKELQSQISNFIHQCIYKLLLDKSEAIDQFYQEIVNILVEDFKKKHKPFTERLQQLVFQEAQSILLYKDFGKLPTSLQDKFQSLERKIMRYVSSLKKNDYATMQQLLDKHKISFTPDKLVVTPIELGKYSILQEGLESQEEATRKKISEVLDEHGCITGTQDQKICTNQKFRRSLEREKAASSKFDKFVLEKVLGLGKEYVTKGSFSYSRFNKDEILELSFILFKNAVDKERKRSPSIIKKGKIKKNANIQESESLGSYADSLHEFIPLTPQRICQVIAQNVEHVDLKSIIEACIQPLKDFLCQSRKTLPNSYEFDFQNGYSIPSFLANIRLCNRSANRFIKNTNPHTDDLLGRQKQFRSCKFPASNDLALEVQEITKNGIRNDQVINRGSYKEEVYERLMHIRKISGGINKSIAFWIRQILKGEALIELNYAQGGQVVPLELFQVKEIKRILVDITYLLFGTEVARNPASLIHHNMMLDLILSGGPQYKWGTFLVGSDDKPPMLPMELNGAVPYARELHATYNPFMPYPYMYPKGSGGAYCPNELSSREGELTWQWLEKCKNIKINPSTGITEDQQTIIVDAIYQACQAWLGFELGASISSAKEEVGEDGLNMDECKIETPVLDEEARKLVNLGNAYEDLKEHEQKQELLEQVWKIFNIHIHYWKDYLEVGAALVNLGNAYGDLGNYERQQQLLEKALEIFHLHYEEDHPFIAIALTGLVDAYGGLPNHYGKQQEYLDKALKINIMHYKRGYSHTGRTLTSLGNAYGSLGNYEKKKELLEKALKINKEHYGEEHLETGITLTNLGKAYEKLEEAAKASTYYQQAYNIFKRYDHPFASRVEEWIKILKE